MTIKCKVVAKINEKNGVTKFAAISNEEVRYLLTNDKLAEEELNLAMEMHEEVEANVYIPPEAKLTYKWHRDESRA